MAIAGKPSWQCVTTNHIGVPHGGMFGNVRRWEPILAKHGMLLCWSLIWNVFGVYHRLPGGEPVFDMHLKHKDGGPIPLERLLVDTLVFLRETTAREDRSLREEGLRRRNQAKQDKINAELAEERSDRAKRATDKAFMALGLKPKKTMIELGN